MPEQNAGGQRSGDEGGADPTVAAALAAYAAGQGSEHAALTALAGARLLVPVVAVLADPSAETHDADAAHEPGAASAAAPAQPAGHRCDIERLRAPSMSHRRDGTRDGARDGARGRTDGKAGEKAQEKAGEKVSEMALPTLIGHDGRAAVLAFTCLDSLTRWRPDARPLLVPAPRVWQAGAQEAGAVVIDVAGPVPLAVEGARLAALAGAGRAPLPHEDPDVRAAAEVALASEPLITAARLAEPGDGSDVGLQVTLAAGCDAALAGAAVRRAVASLMTATGGRFRRGVGVAVVEAGRLTGRP